MQTRQSWPGVSGPRTPMQATTCHMSTSPTKSRLLMYGYRVSTYTEPRFLQCGLCIAMNNVYPLHSEFGPLTQKEDR